MQRDSTSAGEDTCRMPDARPPCAMPYPLLLAESDPGLARRVQRGDDRAFEVLIRRHQASLARFCRGVLRHDQDAEDALHAAMLRAY